MDLNADLGEGFGIWRLGDDEALLDVITSANVACGFHGGDPSTMRRVCAAAAERRVAIGAQVGYRDLAGFGRRHIAYAFADLRDETTYQLGALDAFCRPYGTRVRYLKPHGALYHAASADESQAAALIAAIDDYDRDLPVLCAPGSALAQLATGAGLRVVAEGFADRGYLPNGTLVPRTALGALVTDPEQVATRAVRMATEKTVVAVDGTVVPCPVDSICLHGDTPGAVASAALVRAALLDAGVALAPFA
ncbi:LamB/YcsF family protein [Micromonospora sp. KC207]|uniref:LamB/YcsF family protein n=1 Tax=Micromonospora carbonacea TaxID=47853 RepID=A0A7D5Y8V7_9ACTN|nr:MULTISPECIES: 5-oxoprolinase subunit PxpA [unclassified Micromonospora]EEP72651.1 LamB/YcsF family protein [Micromonospora sp. ATCC 39149]QLJ98759.1 LamB/YcsF family protein [Micromonospora carbonacea]TDC47082.1 LamB/YcsF family protein [Micromonospora sp. KC207]